MATKKKPATSKADADTKVTKQPTAMPKVVPTPPTPAPVAAVIPPKVVQAAEPVVSSGTLRKADLVQAVVTRTGAKPRDVKPIVEAALDVMGAAIYEGQDLNLPPFGKLRPNRAKTNENARITVAKLRQKLPDAE